MTGPVSSERSCIFCRPSDVLFENALAYAKTDAFPVSCGHTLIIPKRHVPTWFEMTEEEQRAVFELIAKTKAYLDETYHPDGYNIGINCGTAAGQTIMHAHIHVIPRYTGDVKNPRGGVRGVIPEKKDY